MRKASENTLGFCGLRAPRSGNVLLTKKLVFSGRQAGKTAVGRASVSEFDPVARFGRKQEGEVQGMTDSTKNCDMVWFWFGFWHIIDVQRLKRLKKKFKRREKMLLPKWNVLCVVIFLFCSFQAKKKDVT